LPPRGRQPAWRDISTELFQFNDFQVFHKASRARRSSSSATASLYRSSFEGRFLFALRLGPSAALDGHGRRTYGQTDLSLVMDLEWQSPDT
jgi:hypothetical protein